MDRVDDLERENNSLGEALKQQESMLCELRDVIYGVRGLGEDTRNLVDTVHRMQIAEKSKADFVSGHSTVDRTKPVWTHANASFSTCRRRKATSVCCRRR